MVSNPTQSYTSKKLHEDVHAVLSQWEFILLHVQVLLLWKRFVLSLIFYLTVHIIFWTLVLTNQSILFTLSVFMLVYVTFDLCKGYLCPARNKTDQFPEVVRSCLQAHYILSVEEISIYVSKFLLSIGSLINKVLPCRRRHPLLFFLITAGLSIGCIWLSKHVSSVTLLYTLLNVVLMVPLLIHHHVFSRMWQAALPFLQKIDAELDKRSMETVSERETGEAAFWTSIASTSLTATNVDAGGDEARNILSYPDWPNFSNERDPTWNGDDADTSEANFLKKLLPSSILAAGRADEAVNTVAHGMTAYSKEELDALFAEATVGSIELPEPYSVVPGQSSEYNTEDDDLEELTGDYEEEDRGCIDQRPATESEDDGFVVVR